MGFLEKELTFQVRSCYRWFEFTTGFYKADCHFAWASKVGSMSGVNRAHGLELSRFNSSQYAIHHARHT